MFCVFIRTLLFSYLPAARKLIRFQTHFCDDCHQIIYRSTATRVLGSQELARMVEQTRIHNFSQGITGLLFYAKVIFCKRSKVTLRP